jgi:hypothetical protein
MKFRYFKFPIDRPDNFFGNSLLKPIIPVKIINGDKSINYAALIDSGADFCIFDAEVGELVGLDIRRGPKIEFGGIQQLKGSIGYIHNIEIDIGGWPHKIKAVFSYDVAKHGYGILGQRGFFDIFIVKFDLLKEEIELKPRF